MSASSNPLESIRFFNTEGVTLYKDGPGRLMFKGGGVETPVKIVRCFPCTDKDHFISVYAIRPDGRIDKEIALISDIKKLSQDNRRFVEEALSKTFPFTEIKKINAIKYVHAQWEWRVGTSDGEKIFVVGGFQDIYIIQPSFVIIKDVAGNKFFADPATLDNKSNALLEPCL